MKGDRVEIVVDTGDGARTYEVSATRAGRRVEVSTVRGVVEVNEVTRTGTLVRTARFMASVCGAQGPSRLQSAPATLTWGNAAQARVEFSTGFVQQFGARQIINFSGRCPRFGQHAAGCRQCTRRHREAQVVHRLGHIIAASLQRGRARVSLWWAAQVRGARDRNGDR